MAEPPYGEIADLLTLGQVVPFLGAGVNFGTREPREAQWIEGGSNFLPSANELARWLADKIKFPSINDHDRNDLAKVASYFAETSARTRLRKRLQDVFGGNFQPSAAHNYLARIAHYRINNRDFGTPLLVVTTNYDDLTEQAFTSMDPPRPYDLIVHPTDRDDIRGSVLWWKHGLEDPIAVPTSRLYIDLAKVNVIYKMHGSLIRKNPQMDSYVVTEEDYVDFLSGMISQRSIPPLFMRHFRDRHFLFLGYGLHDWNLRVVLKNLKSQTVSENDGELTEISSISQSNDLRSWAIQFRPTELEVALWNARQVKIYDVDIAAFIAGLVQAKGDL